MIDWVVSSKFNVKIGKKKFEPGTVIKVKENKENGDVTISKNDLKFIISNSKWSLFKSSGLVEMQ